MIKPPFLTVVWVPFLAGTLSDTRVEHWDPRMGVAHCQRRSGLMRPGSHGGFSTRCGPGSGTSLHSIVYHWNASWGFLSHGATPQIHPNSPFSIGFYMKFTIQLLGYLPDYGNPQLSNWRRRNPVGWRWKWQLASSSWSQVEKIGYFGPARPHTWWVLYPGH
jgi:hypothetical protein